MSVRGKLFGMRMGVLLLLFCVKGEMPASPQEKSTSKVTDGTSNPKHNVPPLKPQITQKGREKLTGTQKNQFTPAPSNALTLKQKSVGSPGKGKGSADITSKVKRHNGRK
jgi:hypothetical protein